MASIRIYLNGTFEATAAKTDDDGLATVRAAVRAKGLSPHSPRGQALMEQLMQSAPKRKPGQPPVTFDLGQLQKQRTDQMTVLRMLKQDIKKLADKPMLGPVSQQKLDDLTKQLGHEEQKLKGLELSIRRLQKVQSK